MEKKGIRRKTSNEYTDNRYKNGQSILEQIFNLGLDLIHLFEIIYKKKFVHFYGEHVNGI